jgi:hypothetical protein
MPEVPVGYFPDVRVQWTPEMSDEFETEIERARSGREQRRAVGPTNGLMRWGASSTPLKYADREIVRAFLKARRGRLTPFYFFNPIPERFTDVSAGSVTAATRLILPFKESTITDVRVAGVTKAFSSIALIPRSGTYAGLHFLHTSLQSITCGTSATLRATGDQALSAWVFLRDASAARCIAGNETNNASGVLLYVDTDRKIYFRTNQAGANTSAASTGTVPLNTWTHVAITRSGTTVTFYINGVASGSGSTTNPVVATAAFEIGARAGAFLFSGMLNDVRYYSTSLSAGEVSNIYQGNASPNSALAGHWKLTEGTGTTVADSSGYGNTGTLVNSPAWVAGEDEVTFTAGAQTGAVTVTLIGRERVIGRNALDRIAQGFIPNAADLNAVFPMAVQQLF